MIELYLVDCARSSPAVCCSRWRSGALRAAAAQLDETRRSTSEENDINCPKAILASASK